MGWLKRPHGKLASREQLSHPREVTKGWQPIWPTLESLKRIRHDKLHQSITDICIAYSIVKAKGCYLKTICWSSSARWHDGMNPARKPKPPLFFHFPNIIFFIRFHIIMQGYRKTEMVGTRAKTDTMDFFGKQTFSSWFLRKDRWRWWYIWKIYPNPILTYPVASWHSSKLWYISPPFDAILSLVWFDTNKVAVFITWVEKS